MHTVGGNEAFIVLAKQTPKRHSSDRVSLEEVKILTKGKYNAA